MAEEFEEIAHSGGKIAFTIQSDHDGHRTYQVHLSGDRPVPTVVIGIAATPDGEPVSTWNLGFGIGAAVEPPPPGCLPVMIASDSEGRFGHNCPYCKQYWRSGPSPQRCPYCGRRAPAHAFLSAAQLRYVQHYCQVLDEALERDADGTTTINMDEVADAVDKEEKPAFYVSEERQQHKFRCTACDEFNDILGRFGFCSLCGTRNDLADFELTTIPEIRTALNADRPPENCVRDAVSSFDTFLGQLAGELVRRVPMTQRRRSRLENQRFYDIEEIQRNFSAWFDIDVCSDMKEQEHRIVGRLFYRRHVYEHHGGVVDQQYLDRSGDTTVVLGQRIHETKEEAHQLMSCLVKMARNLHSGFHELFPPDEAPINRFAERKSLKSKQ